MNTSKIIKGVAGGGRYTVTAPIIKEDYGLYLQIEGIELPETYEVDFSNDEHSGSSVTMIGNADGVLIPRQFISSGKDVFAFLYHVGADYGRTVFKFRIPNKLRPDRTDEEPTPEEQSVIDQTISALNDAVDRAEEAEQAIEGMSVSATTLAEGESAIVTKTESEGVVHLDFGIPIGATGAKGDKGDKGEKGEKGDKGDTGSSGRDGTDGISPTVSVTDITGGHKVTIIDKSGTKTFDVMDGDDYTLTAQDKQDIAEMVNAPVDDVPPYELLNDFTLEEESGFDLTADMNGTPYDLRNVFIYVYFPANSATVASGYARYRCYDANNNNSNAETGRYGTNTQAMFKYVTLERKANMAISSFTIRETAGGAGTWRTKPLTTNAASGVVFNLGNITRIACIDNEPAGTQIKIYGQRAY